MSEAPKDDEAKFNETLKRMLTSPPKPHVPKPTPPKKGNADEKKNR
jgi:hypothetical protein